MKEIKIQYYKKNTFIATVFLQKYHQVKKYITKYKSSDSTRVEIHVYCLKKTFALMQYLGTKMVMSC